jgi:hypothetical protein
VGRPPPPPHDASINAAAAINKNLFFFIKYKYCNCLQTIFTSKTQEFPDDFRGAKVRKIYL